MKTYFNAFRRAVRVSLFYLLILGTWGQLAQAENAHSQEYLEQYLEKCVTEGRRNSPESSPASEFFSAFQRSTSTYSLIESINAAITNGCLNQEQVENLYGALVNARTSMTADLQRHTDAEIQRSKLLLWYRDRLPEAGALIQALEPRVARSSSRVTTTP